MADHLKVVLTPNHVAGSAISALNKNSTETNGANGNRKSKSPSPPHSGIGAYQNNSDV